MVNYNAFINELFKLELDKTVYSVYDDEVLYDFDHPNYSTNRLTWFYTLKNYFQPTFLYINQLAQLQRQAISEARMLQPVERKNLYLDAIDHQKTLQQLLNIAATCQESWSINTLLELRSTQLLLSQFLNHPAIFIPERPVTNPLPLGDKIFGNQLLELYQIKMSSLNQFIDKINDQPQPSANLAGLQPLTTRQQALLASLQGRTIFKNNGNIHLYNHYIELNTSSNRTAFANESIKRAKALIKDYIAVLPYLSDKERERAENEIIIIKDKRW